MSKLKSGDRVKLKGSGWDGLGWEGRVVVVGDSSSLSAGMFRVPEDWGAQAGLRYYLHSKNTSWGYELLSSHAESSAKRTYSTEEIVSAIRSLTDAGVHRELAVSVVSDRVRAGEAL